MKKFIVLSFLVVSFITNVYAANDSFTIWISAFIPKNVDGAKRTRDGGTMISVSYPLNKIVGCYGTDNRGPSSDQRASYRIQASVSETNKEDKHVFNSSCGLTKKYSCDGNKIEKTGRCNASKIWESKKYKRIGEGTYKYYFDVAGANPLAPSGSPDIDFEITVIEKWLDDGKVKFIAKGRVDPFPAFEAYVRFNGKTKRLFYKSATGTPLSLYKRKPNKEVSGEVFFVSRNH